MQKKFQQCIALIGFILLTGCILIPAKSDLSQSRAPSSSEEEQKNQFFAEKSICLMEVSDWPKDKVQPEALRQAVESNGSKLAIYKIDPNTNPHCGKDDRQRVAESKNFELSTAGNRTEENPKTNYKIKLKKKEKVFAISTLNLKSMWNDASQMREALLWKIFRRADVNIKASRHTYARFCINGIYKGLYSVVENIDEDYLEERFPDSPNGPMYKASWEEDDLGPADLTQRSDGKYFKNPDPNVRTYDAKFKSKDAELQKKLYSDLKILIDAIHDTKLSDHDYQTRIERVFDVEAFLRWAAINYLAGAWDNYWAHPINYSLYNKGTFEKPFFVWLPWDYDNTLGITYWDTTRWENADLLNWQEPTKGRWGGNKQSQLPLIMNLLARGKYRDYYLKQVRYALKHFFNEKYFENEIKNLRRLIEDSAMKESDHEFYPIHTGRFFPNYQVKMAWNNEVVYRDDPQLNAAGQQIFVNGQLLRDHRYVPGILSYVRARHNSADAQLKRLNY